MDLNSWELIQLKKIDNVKWLSGPPGQKPSPHGHWVIVGFIKGNILAAKDGTLIKIPANDVRRVGVYSIDYIMDELKKVGKKRQEIDVAETVSNYLSIDHSEAKKFLLRYGLPDKTDNEIQAAKIVEKVQKLKEGEYNE